MTRTIALLQTNDGEIALTVRVSARARRIGLRVDPRLGGAELVLPKGVSTKRGLSFAASKSDWLRDHLAALPPSIPFLDGAAIPILGLPCTVRHIGRRVAKGLVLGSGVRPGPVWREDDTVYVVGDAPHVERRVRDWLKAEARRRFSEKAGAAAEILGVTVKGITLRDPRSRWGSCSARGTLSFSWRLVLAPESVFDYVVAHEVAHLAEMNHGPRFWALVGRLVEDADTPKDWLRLHGAGLHRYGA